MKVLVAEEVAQEGLEQLRNHHEVDERIGLTREELCSILPEYDALIVIVPQKRGPPLLTILRY